MSPLRTPTLLCVLDGFGLNPNPLGNAVAQAKKPVFDRLWSSAARATLVTHGERVGLPAGQMGNSEVGHLNIGAGRVVEQWLLRISRALAGDYLDHSAVYRNFLKAAHPSGTVHVIGLYSDGGVHSHREHAHLLLARLRRDLPNKIALHLITDGRDVSPHSAGTQIAELQTLMRTLPNTTIATVCGRFYAMDRDKRWERVAKAADLMAAGRGPVAADATLWITERYGAGVTDEFMDPAVIDRVPINTHDSLVFYNFREDRMRELVSALCIPDFSGFTRTFELPQAQRVLGFTEYDHSFRLPFLFPQIEIKNHLGEVLAKLGKTQLRVAETEKYPHVTYFLNGGIEVPYAGEERSLLASPRDVKTYDLKPEMSAEPVTNAVVPAIQGRLYDLIVVNLANCDMVGHTGVLPAAIKAVETVDRCLGRMLDALEHVGGQALILADHGNAEMMINYEDGTPYTAHTTFPVPVVLVGRPEITELRADGSLCDVAPTILKMMGIAQPSEMRGRPLY